MLKSNAQTILFALASGGVVSIAWSYFAGRSVFDAFAGTLTGLALFGLFYLASTASDD